jgi:hypothetical protein
MKFKSRKRNQIAPSREKTSPLAPAASDSARCLFSSSDGRRCGMVRWEDHPSLCLFHARQEQQLLEADRIGAELVSISGEFKTAHDLNHVLGKLFALLANNRIPPRNAAILAYVGQLILQTLPSVKRDVVAAGNHNAWEDTLRRAFPQLAAPQRT